MIVNCTNVCSLLPLCDHNKGLVWIFKYTVGLVRPFQSIFLLQNGINVFNYFGLLFGSKNSDVAFAACTVHYNVACPDEIKLPRAFFGRLEVLLVCGSVKRSTPQVETELRSSRLMCLDTVAQLSNPRRTISDRKE